MQTAPSHVGDINTWSELFDMKRRGNTPSSVSCFNEKATLINLPQELLLVIFRAAQEPNLIHTCRYFYCSLPNFVEYTKDLVAFAFGTRDSDSWLCTREFRPWASFVPPCLNSEWASMDRAALQEQVGRSSWLKVAHISHMFPALFRYAIQQRILEDTNIVMTPQSRAQVEDLFSFNLEQLQEFEMVTIDATIKGERREIWLANSPLTYMCFNDLGPAEPDDDVESERYYDNFDGNARAFDWWSNPNTASAMPVPALEPLATRPYESRLTCTTQELLHSVASSDALRDRAFDHDATKMPRVANPPAGSRATRNMMATPHKTSSMKLALNDDKGEKAARRQALQEIHLNEARSAASPMRKINQSARNRAASDSPQTPRTSNANDLRRRISRRGQHNGEPNSPGQLDVIGTGAVTPMKRVPILANFEEWMKMATDNKINAANSWNFALIDYFHDMSLLKEGDGVNFQKASCTLDGCVKIYTSRVDSVATETGRLLSGLADGAEGKGKKTRESGEDDEEGEDEDEDEEGNKKPREKKAAKSHEATLAPSFASLQLKKLELEFAVDPLFKKASADFDEGGAKGLLLNHLSIDSEGRIVFDSSDDAGDQALNNDQPTEQEDAHSEPSPESGPPEEATKVSEALEEDADIDLDSLAIRFFPDMSVLDTQDICPSMKTFTLGSADLTLPFAKAPEDWREKTKEPGSPHALDSGLDLAEQSGIFLHDAPVLGFDDDDEGIGGFDMNMPDNVGFGEGGEAWARDAALENQLQPVPAGEELDDNLIDGDDGYAVSLDHRDRFRNDQVEHEGLLEYFSKAFNSRAKVGTKQFVTLENWRIHKLQKARSSEGPETAKPTRTRKEKEPFFIDFNGPISSTLQDLLDAPPVSNSQISLPKASRKTKGRNLLDRDDEMIDVKNLMRLWIKPRCRVGRRKNGGYGVVDEGFGARGKQQSEDQDEGRKGDYDANFFAEGEDALPFDGPLPIDDDDDDGLGFGIDEGLGINGNDDFVDAREMLSPGPEGQLQGDLDATLALEGLGLGQDNLLASAEAADAAGLVGSQALLPDGDLPPGSFGSQLVTQQGRRMRPEYVNYARTAKKVDVRRLKENMWKGMAGPLMKDIDAALAKNTAFAPQQAENDGDVDMMEVDQDSATDTPGPATPQNGNVADLKEGEVLKFTQMISDLQKVYPAQQMKDISTSYCFICLLHLANEKGLVLEGDVLGDADSQEQALENAQQHQQKGLMQEILVRRDRSVGEGYEGE
ncbi:Condensin complex subunit 2 [Cyphellophora attinorum]|uniref:Condensin complex subunit 2 n=1 Tax=Cyphellophora attinorum TaxID=1664694 RepID=A0A0N1HI64_9EURO|nr:Condensin complex subunit 2 [Phialophora attinorum]KPI45924.1 Condensin complex subunit 2 [Phialophora attinorum]